MVKRKRGFSFTTDRGARKKQKLFAKYKAGRKTVSRRGELIVKRQYNGFLNIPVNSTTTQTSRITFAASDLTNFNDYANLYDQYKICAIKIKFHKMVSPEMPLLVNPNVGETTTWPNLPFLYGLVDYNYASSGITVSQMREYGNVRFWKPFTEQTFYFRPCIEQPATVPGGTSNAVTVKSKWIDTDVNNILHHGFVIGNDPFSFTSITNANARLDYTVTLYMKFKNVI